MRSWLSFPFLFALAACSAQPDLSPVHVDVIGYPESLEKPFAHASSAAGATILGATDQGLLGLDAAGGIVDGLAARWIVEEGGRSFIFRLKRARWADGNAVKAEDAARLLRARFAVSKALLGGLRPKVKTMTDEVIEVDLDAPMPLFLQLLADPALAIAPAGGGSGPLVRHPGDGGYILRPPEAGEAAPAGEDDTSEDTPMPDIHLRAHRAALAIARFKQGHSDLVLGGRFQHLPLINVASLGDTLVRADPVSGLFGLLVEGESEFLANRDVREALSMAIDRARIADLLNLAGWQTRLTLLPEPLDIGRAPTPASWTTQPIALRQSYARSVVANWNSTRPQPAPRLRIALPAGPGARIVYAALARDFAGIGLSIRPVGPTDKADLRLIDEVAPFDSAIWYIGRTGCDFTPACSVNADARLKLAHTAETDEERTTALAEAEAQAVADVVFLPLGQPIRFSLVRPRLTGYALSPRGYHPLNRLFKSPSEARR